MKRFDITTQRFHFDTGEIIAPDAEYDFKHRWQIHGWVPYYALDGHYIGCKCSNGYYSPIVKFVNTYEELVW